MNTCLCPPGYLLTHCAGNRVSVLEVWCWEHEQYGQFRIRAPDVKDVNLGKDTAFWFLFFPIILKYLAESIFQSLKSEIKLYSMAIGPLVKPNHSNQAGPFACIFAHIPLNPSSTYLSWDAWCGGPGIRSTGKGRNHCYLANIAGLDLLIPFPQLTEGYAGALKVLANFIMVCCCQEMPRKKRKVILFFHNLESLSLEGNVVHRWVQILVLMWTAMPNILYTSKNKSITSWSSAEKWVSAHVPSAFCKSMTEAWVTTSGIVATGWSVSH